MDNWTSEKIRKCPECGTLLSSRLRVENEIRRADESLARFTKKLLKETRERKNGRRKNSASRRNKR